MKLEYSFFPEYYDLFFYTGALQYSTVMVSKYLPRSSSDLVFAVDQSITVPPESPPPPLSYESTEPLAL